MGVGPIQWEVGPIQWEVGPIQWELDLYSGRYKTTFFFKVVPFQGILVGG